MARLYGPALLVIFLAAAVMQTMAATTTLLTTSFEAGAGEGVCGHKNTTDD